MKMNQSDTKAILSGVQLTIRTIGFSLYPPAIVEAAEEAVKNKVGAKSKAGSRALLKRRNRKFRLSKTSRPT